METSIMVPGMSERETRAADLQRLAWLADAVVGPPRRPIRDVGAPGNDASTPLAFFRRMLAAASAPRHRASNFDVRSTSSPPAAIERQTA
jgi:hypothetical protein